MAYDYQLKQYDDLSARWYSKAFLFSEKVKTKFFSVLKFPFGGWMCEIKDFNSIDTIEDEMNDDEDLLSDENNENNISNDEDDQLMNTGEAHESRRQTRKEKMTELKEKQNIPIPNFFKTYFFKTYIFIFSDLYFNFY